MLVEDFTIQRNKLIKCIKYKDYSTAIFICMYLAELNSDFDLLVPILLYENKEYSRSLFYLGADNDVTKLYYKVLNYKANQRYNEAIEYLTTILEGRAVVENITDPFVKLYNLSMDDREFYEALMGELLILKGKSQVSIEKYRRSFFKSPLLGTCYGLLDENIWIAPINDHKNDIIMNFYQDLFKMNIQNDITHTVPENIEQLKQQFPVINKYFMCSPGYGSYFLSKIGALFCRYTNSLVGNEIFRYLREMDPHYIYDMDSYSTSLWVNKNFNLLGLLTKELIISAPDHHITWSVLGNFYSLTGDSKESMSCLMKSISILETPYTYTLLGLESMARKQCLEAQTFFRSSMAMLENNDRAFFGMGMSFRDMQKRNAAETYFNKALALNPRNLNMRAMMIKFYVQFRTDDISLQKITEFMGLETCGCSDIAKYIKSRIGYFKEMEELVILEFVELLVRKGMKVMAKEILSCVNCRTKTYFNKKSLLENYE